MGCLVFKASLLFGLIQDKCVSGRGCAPFGPSLSPGLLLQPILQSFNVGSNNDDVLLK